MTGPPRWLRRAQRQAVKTREHDRAWVVRMAHWGVRVLAIVMTLALVFTMVNVQQFAAQGHPEFGVQWWIAWLLDPMASLTMVAAIVYEGLLSDYGKLRVVWLEITKWYAGIGTWGMNIWSSAAVSSWHGVWLHSIAPGIALGLAQAAPRVRRHIAEILEELSDAVTAQVSPVGPVAEDLSAPTYPRVAAPVAWVPPSRPAGVPAAPVRDDPVVGNEHASVPTSPPVLPAPEPVRVLDAEPVADPVPVTDTASPDVLATGDEPVEVAPEPTVDAGVPAGAASSGAASDEPVTSLEDQVRAILDKHGPLGRGRIIALLPDPKPTSYQVRTVLERMRADGVPALNGAGVKSGSAGSVGDADAA
ncbi:MAG: hypothetical protein JO296_08420 [Pseudonocardiales bacterium]|nr:hypothetical protein [Pseudonocardiales bacterium]MBV9650149.1 hypothetical protein [Pseudonocardiales bacterium]